MSTDDTDLDVDVSLDELERQATIARAQRTVRWARLVAAAALVSAVALLLVERSLMWRLVGYISAGLIATSSMAVAARQSAVLRPFEDRQSARRVVIFNLVCVVVAAVHMTYVARRFW